MEKHGRHDGGSFGVVFTVFAGLAVLALFALLRSVYTNLVRSPLRRVPGPLLAKLTPAWLFVVDFSGQRPHVVHRLHQRYGPVVRVAPNELAFASAAAVRDIYVGVDVPASDGGSGPASPQPPPSGENKESDSHGATTTKTFPKSNRYAIARRPNVSTMRDEAEHRARVRRIGHSFSTALLPDMEPIMRAEIAHLLRQLEGARGTEVDALHMFRSLALDVTGQLFLGKSFGALTSRSTPLFMHYMDTAVHAMILKSMFPLVFRLLQCIPSKGLQMFLDSGDGIFEYGTEAFHDFIARHGRNSALRLPLARLVAGNPARGIAPLPDADLCEEITLMMFAGSDTSATTLAYLFFELAQHRAWYERLRTEVTAARDKAALSSSSPHVNGAASASASAAVKDSDGAGRPTADGSAQQQHQWLTYASLSTLPVLNAVVWETLRMYPPVPGTLSRVVPPGGAPVSAASEACPPWLPEGTVVSAQAYTLQRTAAVFAEPDRWDPSRWMRRTPPNPNTTSITTSSSDKINNNDNTHNNVASNGQPTSGGGADKAVRSGGKGGESGDVPHGAATAAAAVAQDGDNGSGGDAGWEIRDDDAMRAHMLVFSKGVRACIGKNIALVELKLAAAAVAARFAGVRLADAPRTRADMRITDRFVLLPAGRRCGLVFE